MNIDQLTREEIETVIDCLWEVTYQMVTDPSPSLQWEDDPALTEENAKRLVEFDRINEVLRKFLEAKEKLEKSPG